MTRYTVVTTFNQDGLDSYAQRFIDTFDQNMPIEIDLILYAENCCPKVPVSTQRNIKIIQAQEALDRLMRFKSKYATDRRATDIEYIHRYINNRRKTWFRRLCSLGKDTEHFLKSLWDGKKRKRIKGSVKDCEGKRYKWDFIRFSHKPYAVIDASRRVNSEILIWMDADSVVHSKVPIQFLDDLMDGRHFTCYLGRKDFHSECGWYSMRLSHQHADAFFNEFERMYEQAERGIFLLDEWHDSYVWDHVRLWHERKYGTDNKSISGKGYFTGHPLANSCLSQYFDHLKGSLKSEKGSHQKDLRANRKDSDGLDSGLVRFFSTIRLAHP
jgi:hypothetical protein